MLTRRREPLSSAPFESGNYEADPAEPAPATIYTDVRLPACVLASNAAARDSVPRSPPSRKPSGA